MKRQTILQLAILVALVLTINPAFAGRIVYVDADATGNNDGSSWTDAYNYLQDALFGAVSGDEIWVAEGIYKPDQGIGITPGDRTATFQLINGATLKGGYAGFGQPDPNTRNIEAYETILSGDLNGDDEPKFANNAENSYHVVTAYEVDETTCLEGFTISGGNANGKSGFSYTGYDGNDGGGGMLINASWPTEHSSPIISNCLFRDNRAVYGAGIYSYRGPATIENCIFEGNIAERYGGGIHNVLGGGTKIVRSCLFIDNQAFSGGGLCYFYSRATVTNCVFAGNFAHFDGSAIVSPTGTVTNCTFYGNHVDDDTAVVVNGMGELYIINSILWDDTHTEGYYEIAALTYVYISHCDIRGGEAGVYIHPWGLGDILNWGPGNIDADPLFVELGYWADVNDQNIVVEPNDPNAIWVDGDYHLLQDSPCIDAGDPDYIAEPNETDLDGKLRIIGGRIDMGAYEFQGSRILYVDADASGANDGLSWADAYNYLQDALSAAWSGDEIWVAEGIYTPDSNSANPNGSADQTATFQLINGATLKGGYAGFGQPDPNTRNIEAYETILSGDLNGNDGLNFANNDENSYHVVTGSGTDNTAVLNGFTITGGNANHIPQHSLVYDPDYRGGGMYNDVGSPTLINCTFSKNLAGSGGGMYNQLSSPTVINCIFTENMSAGGFGRDRGGGGILNNRSSPALINCTFNGNCATYGGGGMRNYDNSNSTVTNCRFIGNLAGGGGGMDNMESHPTLSGCTFSGNEAFIGGGIYCNGSSPTITDCVITKNVATSNKFGFGGGIFCGLLGSGSKPITINNCVVSGNRAFAGGGICCDGGSGGGPGKIDINGCIITGNIATSIYHGGGGIFCSNYIPKIANCTINGNIARRWGGGMYNAGSNAILTNCTFNQNWAGENGGGMYNRASSSPILTNCILWGDAPEEIYVYYGATPVITYTNVEGGWPSLGNIDADPLFVELGYWADVNDQNIVVEPNDPNAIWVDGDYHLLQGSPCIDAGDPNYIPEPNETDLDGHPRIIGGRIDMGAYESLVPAEVRIVPRTINLASKGKWITCYISLPEDYNIADIDPNSVLLENEIQPDEFSADEQKQVAVLRFSREKLRGILNVGDAELTITGRLTDGTVFEGTDIIRVINKGGKK